MQDSPLAGPEWAGFLTHLRFRGDDTDFLVAADWLQDRGRPEFESWAEFVRCQVAAAAADRAGPRSHVYTDSCDCERCRPERRAAALFDRWGGHWVSHSFPVIEGARFDPLPLRWFSRGFPIAAEVSIAGFRIAAVPGQAVELWRRAPLGVAHVVLADTSPVYWRLHLAFAPARSPNLFAVSAELQAGLRRPFLGFSPRKVRATRHLLAKDRFDRAVGGAAREVMRRRDECDLPLLTVELGGEG